MGLTGYIKNIRREVEGLVALTDQVRRGSVSAGALVPVIERKAKLIGKQLEAVEKQLA